MSSVEWEAQRLLGRGQLLAMLLGRAAYSEIMACSAYTLEGEPSLDTPLHLADGKDGKKNHKSFRRSTETLRANTEHSLASHCSWWTYMVLSVTLGR